MKKTLLLMACWASLAACQTKTGQRIDLSGEWRFAIDSTDSGVRERWFARELDEFITLPGSMNTNGKGETVTVETPWTASVPNRAWYDSPEYADYRRSADTKVVFFLQPDKYYVGPAWYQKPIEVPEAWAGKVVRLRLERCHWQSSLWVDEREIGAANSLATPHEYLLEGLTPGTHRLSLRVDNRVLEIDPGVDAHSISDHTQSNWNGLVGTLEAEALPNVFIEQVKITPDPTSKTLQVALSLQNRSGSIQNATLTLGGRQLRATKSEATLAAGENILEISVPWRGELKRWDEFSPNMYELTSTLSSEAGEHSLQTSFGVRTIGTQGTQITINDRPVFLRGTLECCIFPLTGYPATDEASWERIIRICKDHGLNHMRFHSWCPPEAAFRAGDRLGFYFQVECGAWANDIGSGKGIDDYIRRESRRIVNAYANHPSFCLLSSGNEPHGPHMEQYMHEFVDYWRSQDRRFLTTTAAAWPIYAGSDYDNDFLPRIQLWDEQLRSVINAQPPRSNFNWSDRISTEKPTVSHEIGQWCVYPDLKERARYTGAFKARNFDIFEDRLRASDLLHLADSFLLASGKLQALCYKADIEAALRTPGFGGFQLLDLHDFPGQGTALVGVLNPFWEEKGYITAGEFRAFCNEVVPLLVTDRFVYHSGDTLRGRIEVAQFSPKDFSENRLSWQLQNKEGSRVAGGEWNVEKLPTGALSPAGELELPLQTDTPQQYRLSLELNGKYENAWNIWVYPRAEAAAPEGVRVARRFGPEEEAYLAQGGSLLLVAQRGSLRNEGADSVCVGFSSIFWNTLWTLNQAPHTLGILCDPGHPALSLFPTAYHSDYQWWDALSDCDALPLHKLGNPQPVVRLIDDWFKGRSLGLVAEVRVGPGKLLLCGADLLADPENRPAAGQLHQSLLHYAASDDFRPRTACTPEQIRALFR